MRIDTFNCLNKDCIYLLEKNKFLKPLIRSQVITETLSKIEIEERVKTECINKLRKELQIETEEKLEIWMKNNFYNKEDLENIALTQIRLNKYCDTHFSNKIESHFLKRKKDLDIIIYSLIRLDNPYTAKELYLRIVGKEASFGDIAAEYSQGIERKSRGIVGPATIAQTNKKLAAHLVESDPGVLQQPIEIDGNFLIVRVESYDPAKLDDYMREKMNQELFNIYLEEKSLEIRDSLLSMNQNLKLAI